MLAARWWRPGLAGVLLGLALIAALLLFLNGSDEVSTTPSKPAADHKQGAPNVVVVMTDDQALDTMRAMPRTQRLLGDRGVSFNNAVVSFPLCCPSRATFLTGQYAHNHRVLDNHPPRGGYQRLDAEHTLPVWLSGAGYRTGFVGKFLNGYGESDVGGDLEIPRGWDEWYGLPKDGKRRPFDFQLNENGTLVDYADRDRDYKTDVLARKSASFIRGNSRSKHPFFLWVATNAPHLDLIGKEGEAADRNPEPAPRDRGRFEGHRPPQPASVDEKDVSDKPRFVKRQSRLRGKQRAEIEKIYVSQLEALASVDRLVERVVKAVRRQGELDRTVVMFTSDNGFLRGQHRLDSGKSKFYEESIRVPLLVRGPGFPEGVRDERMVGNVDLAPTILDLAEAGAGREPDGISMLPFDREGDDRERDVLLEIFERKSGRGVAVRNRRFVYAEYEGGTRELYDLERDPEQLDSVHNDPGYAEVRGRLAERLAELRNCSGSSCH